MTLNTVWCLVLCIHFLDVTSSSIDCTGDTYKSSNDYSCYPCGPGFHVLKECPENGTTNTCVPCKEGYFQSACTAQATRCKQCGFCHDPKEIVAKNCTKTQDTVCACEDGSHKDISDHICTSHCRPGNKIVMTPGEEWKGSLCVPCEAGTFSTKENSTECATCTSCSDYINNCTRTTDAVCKHQTTKAVTTAGTQQTTKAVTTTLKVTSAPTATPLPDTADSSTKCKESGRSDAEIALTVLAPILFAICIAECVVIIKREKIFQRSQNGSTCSTNKMGYKKSDSIKSEEKDPLTGRKKLEDNQSQGDVQDVTASGSQPAKPSKQNETEQPKQQQQQVKPEPSILEDDNKGQTADGKKVDLTKTSIEEGIHSVNSEKNLNQTCHIHEDVLKKIVFPCNELESCTQ